MWIGLERKRPEDEVGGVDDDDHREDDGLAAGVEQRLDGVDGHEEGESDQTAHHRPAVGGEYSERWGVQGYGESNPQAALVTRAMGLATTRTRLISWLDMSKPP